MRKKIVGDKIKNAVNGDAQTDRKRDRFRQRVLGENEKQDRTSAENYRENIVELQRTLAGNVMRFVDPPQNPVKKPAVNDVRKNLQTDESGDDQSYKLHRIYCIKDFLLNEFAGIVKMIQFETFSPIFKECFLPAEHAEYAKVFSFFLRTPLAESLESNLSDIKNMKKELEQTEKTKLKRLPKRGHFDRETIYSVLDEAFICHVGFTVDGQTFVIPTSFVRDGDKIYIHGASVSRMLKSLAEGIEICVTVTLIDGLVLARSVFNHSMNYRSVVMFGRAEMIEDRDEKMKALHIFTEKLIPGRWDDSRIPNEKELNVTTVLSLDITEASAKVRTGDPSDDKKDYETDFWAGVVPLKLTAADPIDDSELKEGIEQPGYLFDMERFRK